MNTFLQMLLNQQGGAQALPNSFVDAVANGQGWGKLAPISQVPMSEDDAGNQYAANGSIIRKGIAPGSMTLGETALAGATAPAKLATGLASTLSPYGSDGFQVPPILAEPVRAGNRLLNSGGFPDPQDPQNQQDAVTSLLSFFGANAFGGARAGAGAAAALSDTSRPSVMGSAVGSAEQQPIRAYHGTGATIDRFNTEHVFASTDPGVASKYSDWYPGGGSPQVLPLDMHFGRVLSRSDPKLAGLDMDEIHAAARLGGYDGVDWGEGTYSAVQPNTVRSATTGEVLFSDTSRPSLLGSAVAAEQAPTKGITAYHGSPHDFDKFDMSKIGTGEGAQAYGHGLYFAENEGVARSYRNALSPSVLSTSDGAAQTITARPSALSTSQAERVAASIKEAGGYDAAVTNAQKAIASAGDGPLSGMRKALAEDQMRSLEAYAGMNPEVKSSGHMYQVRINADPNDFLDWDKPLSQQPASAQEAITKHPAFVPPLSDNPDNFMRNAMRDPETSALLKGAGIPGIKYLDQMSRNAGDGSRNYVVFNADDVEILRKYGLLAPLFASGMRQVGDEQ